MIPSICHLENGPIFNRKSVNVDSWIWQDHKPAMTGNGKDTNYGDGPQGPQVRVASQVTRSSLRRPRRSVSCPTSLGPKSTSGDVHRGFIGGNPSANPNQWYIYIYIYICMYLYIYIYIYKNNVYSIGMRDMIRNDFWMMWHSLSDLIMYVVYMDCLMNIMINPDDYEEKLRIWWNLERNMERVSTKWSCIWWDGDVWWPTWIHLWFNDQMSGNLMWLHDVTHDIKIFSWTVWFYDVIMVK